MTRQHTGGVVAAGSEEAAQAGAAMLRQGGNAVDAAVAATLAGFVAEATISNLGGGGFALVQGPGREAVLYDFFCATPGLGGPINRDRLDFTALPLHFGGTSCTYHVGRGSSAVPGNLAGLAMLLAEWGTLPWAAVLAPAERLAREGFIINAMQGYLFALLEGILRYTPESAAIFLPGGERPRAGDRFRNPALAETLARLANDGPDLLYRGDLGAALVADHAARGGLITQTDLDAYRVIKRQPLRLTYAGYTVYTTPPPSAGGILIAYALNLLARADLGKLTHGDADHVALLAEVMRAAILARRQDAPESLVEPAAWQAWLNGERLDHAWAAVARALESGPPEAASDDLPGPANTTHISVIDANGLAVGLTTTPGEAAGYVVGETGMAMNNILGEADLNPNGFHQWEPGARLASMMAPTLVSDDSGARLVVGSGGSNRLRGAILQVLSNVCDWGHDVAAAVHAPRVHFEANVLDLEAGFNPAAADALAGRGYAVNRWQARNLYFGGAHVAARGRDGSLSGAGDDRRGGAVVVVD